jgi:hypothetical protein
VKSALLLRSLVVADIPVEVSVRLQRLLLAPLLAVALVSGACKKHQTAPLGATSHDPVIDSLVVTPSSIAVTDTLTVRCYAHDADADTLYHDWEGQFGMNIVGNPNVEANILNNTITNTQRLYPNFPVSQLDTLYVVCEVRDGKGGSAIKLVYFTVHP